jgi:hypothetical protein
VGALSLYHRLLKRLRFSGRSRVRLHPSRGSKNSCRQAGLLQQACDDVLKDVDVLAIPTLSFTAPISPGEAPLVEFIEVVLNMQANTCSFDVSEPSAFAVPCGLVRGLPVEEVTLIQLVQTIEKTAIGRNTRAKARGSDNDTNGLALSRIARGR